MNRRFKECIERKALYRSEEARGPAEKETELQKFHNQALCLHFIDL